jgi:hypothetical protein
MATNQMIFLAILASVFVLGLVFYPGATLRLIATTLRVLTGLIKDALILLVAWGR